jgi:hypothetical protein
MFDEQCLSNRELELQFKGGDMPHEAELVRRAMAAYFRKPKLPLEMTLQPSQASGVQTHAGKDYVVLHNVNGVLAVYRVRNDGMLKGLKRWPNELGLT